MQGQRVHGLELINSSNITWYAKKKNEYIFSTLQDLLPSTQQQTVERKTEGGPGASSESSCGTSAPEASTESRKTDIIDDLLGGLSSDLEKIGVQTTAKGNCASCKKCIVGKVRVFPRMHLNETFYNPSTSFRNYSIWQVITALGEMWHPEHFLCVACQTELSGTDFFERDGRPYCDKDYHQLFSPRCAYCQGPILHVRKKASFCYSLILLSPLWEKKTEWSLRIMCFICFPEHPDSAGPDLAPWTLFLFLLWRPVWIWRSGGGLRGNFSPPEKSRLANSWK